MLLCVALSHEVDEGVDDTVVLLLPHAPVVHMFDVPISQLTQRQLLDQVSRGFAVGLMWRRCRFAH